MKILSDTTVENLVNGVSLSSVAIKGDLPLGFLNGNNLGKINDIRINEELSTMTINFGGKTITLEVSILSVK